MQADDVSVWKWAGLQDYLIAVSRALPCELIRKTNSNCSVITRFLVAGCYKNAEIAVKIRYFSLDSFCFSAPTPGDCNLRMALAALFGRRKTPEEMLRQNQRALQKVGRKEGGRGRGEGKEPTKHRDGEK